MKAVVQRVSGGRLTVNGAFRGEIGRGLVVLVGIGRCDTAKEAAWLAGKILALRIFEDAEGRMNRSLDQVAGGVILVSQFTLYGDCRNGNRPGFTAAEEPGLAEPLYREFVELVKARVPAAVSGDFGARMLVEIANDGPVTLLLETRPGREP